MSKTYEKNFDSWNRLKKIIDCKVGIPPFKERQIWWCNIGRNIGSEEDGKGECFLRPVILFRAFSETIAWVIPLTTQPWPIDSRVHYTFVLHGMTRAAEMHQLRLISTKRLDRYMDTIAFCDFQKIRKLVAGLM